MSVRKVWKLVFALFIAPTILHADTLTVGNPVTGISLTISDQSLTNVGYNQVTAYIDPYQGSLNGNQVLLFCVDPDHFDGSGPYSVNLSPAGAGSSTEQVVFDGKTPAQAQNLYGEEAYLATLLLNTPSSQTTTQQEIQGAIWQLADSTVTFPGASGTFNSAVSSYESAAQSNAFTGGFEIATDTACTTASNCVNTRQEYLVLTPEPSSLGMIGVGFLSFLGALKRKRSLI
jgi:hypothetical protein